MTAVLQPAPLASSGLPAMDQAVFSMPKRIEGGHRYNTKFGSLVSSMEGTRGQSLEVTVPAVQQHVLALRLEGSATSLVVSEGRESRVSLRPGSLTLIPAGVPSVWQAPFVGQRIMHFHVAPAWLDMLGEEAGMPGASGRLPVSLGFVHGPLASLIARLRRLQDHDMPDHAPEIELAGMACVLELLRLTMKGGARPLRQHHMSPAALRRVLDLVEAELDGGLSLAAMAAEARLSPFHFARAFKAETGLAPAAYVMSRRCEAARRLILSSRLPLAEIALACGFAHQSHFTTAFRRVTGVTPGRLRRETRSGLLAQA